ncbi:ankyrin repeat, SAM and basic leucine zipper domain-containing protein 1-like [Uloborus diversus]|uniref:ankyrin repeat, SAM and basic leucine zipper domain-containing protein 1-like n=1 Tax=Uloborus diversus TaxID=327109 RepID=UPI00240A8727|nr:ankyrin repeat, SAM and basic leucine zipper domain-containing protein 1-like [Uloborus diversus]
MIKAIVSNRSKGITESNNIINIGTTSVSSALAQANAFCFHYCSRSSLPGIPLDFNFNHSHHLDKNFSIQELNIAINHMKNTSPGEDGIPAKIFKLMPDKIKTNLLKHLNSMWDNVTIPDNWKTSIIIPIKKPNKPAADISSYRPIALALAMNKSVAFEALISRIAEGDVANLRNILLNKHCSANECDEFGQTLLMIAAQQGQIAIVNELLAHGADVNAEDADNWSALTNAAKFGFKEIVVKLLDHGADIEHRDMHGTSPLVWACRKGYTEIVPLILEAGANVDTAGMVT